MYSDNPKEVLPKLFETLTPYTAKLFVELKANNKGLFIRPTYVDGEYYLELLELDLQSGRKLENNHFPKVNISAKELEKIAKQRGALKTEPVKQLETIHETEEFTEIDETEEPQPEPRRLALPSHSISIPENLAHI